MPVRAQASERLREVKAGPLKSLTDIARCWTRCLAISSWVSSESARKVPLSERVRVMRPSSPWRL